MDDLLFKNYCINQCKTYTPFKEKWNYEDGCLLKGFLDCFLGYACMGEDGSLFLTQTLNYLDKNIDTHGHLRCYNALDYSTDDVASGVILFPLYQLTGDVRYRKAIQQLYMQLQYHPRIKAGNFWHKKIYPHQVWLDGLYMAQPFLAKSIKLMQGEKEADYNDIIQQFLFVEKTMKDGLTGLYYHGYDDSRTQTWANKETGLSPTFWSRSMGWLAMALVDVIEVIGAENSKIFPLTAMLNDLLDTLLKFQDKNSLMWYQVTDKPNSKKNYLETSATLMFCYAMLKGYRLKVLPVDYFEKGEASFTSTLKCFCNGVDFDHMCVVAGLGKAPYGSGVYRDGSEDYYYSEPVKANDPKGVGVAMMAYAQLLIIRQKDKDKK